MLSRVVKTTASVSLVLLIAVFAIACGDDEEVEAPAASAPTAPSPAAEAEGPPPSVAEPSAPVASGAEDPERECRIMARCERKCQHECASEERDRGAYYQAKRGRIGESPFEVSVERVYLKGSCHRGDKPEKRRDASGIAAVVEGTMTYTGSDVLYRAEPRGTMYLRFGDSQYHETSIAERSYSYYGRGKPVSRFLREVRGVDPWGSGESRPFHWEAKAIDSVYCELNPDAAEAYIEMYTLGVHGGRKVQPVQFVTLPWDEVVGMALRQQVKVLVKKKKELIEEPADAHYSKLDRILVTRLTGKTEWLRRSSIVQSGELNRGPAAAFPVEAQNAEWNVKVEGITQAKEFGGYAPKGEDQFLAVVDIDLTYSPTAGEGEPAPKSLKGLSVRLETSPGKWQRPVTKAMGQLDTAVELEPGGSIAGKMVFPRQRFDRPFRIEVKTPDKVTALLDVFDYAVGPERAR